MRSRLARLLTAVGIAALVLFVQFLLGVVCAIFVDDVIAVTLLANAVIIVVISWLRIRAPRRFAYRGAPERLTRRDAGWLAVGLPTVFLTSQAAARWAQEHLDTSLLDDIEGALDQANPSLGVLLLTVVVIGPIAEELLMRGLLFPLLRRHVSLWPAVAISSLAFALMHGNYQQGMLALVLGAFFAVVVERTRRVWPVALMHMTANAIALLMPEPWLDAATSGPVAVVFAVIAVVAIIRIGGGRGTAGLSGDSRVEVEGVDTGSGAGTPGDVGALETTGVDADPGESIPGVTKLAGPGDARPGVPGRAVANPGDADGAEATPATTDQSEGNPG